MNKRLNFLLAKPLAALLLCAVMLLSPLSALAENRIVIPAVSCGPGTSLKEAGRSHLKVPFLQHENGAKLKPSEARTAPDSRWYLPVSAAVNAVSDRQAYNSFMKEEEALFGHPKPCLSKASNRRGPPCEEQQLKAANDRANKAEKDLGVVNDQLKAANDRAIQAESALKAANDLLARTKNNVPWGWLLVALFLGLAIGAAVINFFANRSEKDEEPGDKPTDKPETPNRQVIPVERQTDTAAPAAGNAVPTERVDHLAKLEPPVIAAEPVAAEPGSPPDTAPPEEGRHTVTRFP